MFIKIYLSVLNHLYPQDIGCKTKIYKYEITHVVNSTSGFLFAVNDCLDVRVNLFGNSKWCS